MTAPLLPPRRKNPILRTRLATSPPSARGRVALGLTAGAARGVLRLQHCGNCGGVQYPPREVCGTCLSAVLHWRDTNGAGELLARTAIRYGQELYFRERGPWPTGLVRLDVGPNLIVAVHGDCGSPPTRVRVVAALDKAGQAMLIALPEKDTPNMADDPIMRETSCDPKFRKVLVSDGKTAMGRAIVGAMLAAEAKMVWVGYAQPWKSSIHLDHLRNLPKVTLVPLDVTDEASVRELSGGIGAKVDILVNTAEHHRIEGVSGYGVETARAEMDVNYLGLLRLAQSFAPALKARAADGPASAVAWVNVLSVYALSNLPTHATFSASKAAALSLSQALRADLQASGIRLVNVFPGPIDDEWNQLVLPPKLSPAALAAAIVEALKGGVEDVYPGDVAKDWLARFLDNPKALEREAAG